MKRFDARWRKMMNTNKTGKVEFFIKDGGLEIKATYDGEREKKEVEAVARKMSERFQMELFGIIAELLGYKIRISEAAPDGTNALVLEGEKEEDAGVHKYLKISVNTAGEGVFAFEHFDSPASVKQERAKFLALADKLGIKIRLSDERQAGQPIPAGVEHRHFLKGAQA